MVDPIGDLRDCEDVEPIPRSLIEHYVTERVRRGELTERSARNYRSYLKVWHDHAGPVEAWTHQMAAEWVHDPTVRPNTRRTRLNRLRSYTRWLVREGILGANICDEIATPVIPRPTPRDLSTVEVSSVFTYATDDRTLLVLMLMVHCGLRSVDISRALVEDIDTRTRMLAVRAKGGRGEVTHYAAIPSELWPVLIDWVRGLGRTAGPLIANERRLTPVAVSPGHISKIAYGPIKAAGLKTMAFDGVSPHACRHSCAQHMLDEGANIRHVQAQLGHRHQNTTEIYLRRRPEGLAEAADGRSYLGGTGQ